MSQIIPIYIPTYINNAEYAPARVLPRLLFYNGLIDCQTYYIESGSLTTSGNTIEQSRFPYFDNYNVVSGSFPTTDSLSLLFNNENAAYGQIPTENLYTTYWEKYISLLYNPYTRLINCEAIIPLADYFDMELNDVVNFRGNYYHLRAINEYSLKTGECKLQLLGPILSDVFDDAPTTPTTTTTSTTSTTSTTTTTTSTTTTTTTTAPPTGSATLSWTYSVLGGPTSNAMDIKINSSTEISRTSTSSGTYPVYVGDTIQVIISCNGCSGGNAVANAYTDGIIMDASCTGGASSTTLNSTTYTVVSGNVGNTLTLDCYAQCDGGCL